MIKIRVFKNYNTIKNKTYIERITQHQSLWDGILNIEHHLLKENKLYEPSSYFQWRKTFFFDK